MDQENDVQGNDAYDNFDAGSGTDSNSSQTNDDMYAPYLDKFPSSLHGVARDVFKEWDGNVTKRIQAVHDEYAPYRQVIEEYEPSAVQEAITLAHSLESDPEGFYKALAGAYGFEAQQAAQEVIEEQQDDTQQFDSPYGDAVPPQLLQQLSQQEQLLTSVAEYIVSQRQQEEQVARESQENAEFDVLWADLQQRYGSFDDAYVLSLIAQGADPYAAVEHFQQTVNAFAQQQNAPASEAPVVMSSGGGVPSGNLSPNSLNGNQTQDLVAQLLRQAKENG